jgi:hypothetical protein
VDCSRAIYEQDLKKVAIPLKIVAVFEPSEKSCQFSEEKRQISEKKKWFVSLWLLYGKERNTDGRVWVNNNIV